MTVPLPHRASTSGYESQLLVHHAPDFSRFAIGEYDERAFGTTPAAQLHIIDPEAGSEFAVPVLDTAYAMAFSEDGAFAYVASSQLGTIQRIDLAKQQIDRTTHGPTNSHDLVISADGKSLFVVASSRRYVELALPDLDRATTHVHARSLASSAEHLYGSGCVSADGRFYVMPSASTGAPAVIVTQFIER